MKKAAAEKAVADPLLRIFQFDQTSFGEIANWVNLFRGEVSNTLPLVSLPGRNGLEVKVSLLYSSNVWNEARAWNQTAPTSVLGLGWTLPIDAIVATPNRTGRIEEYAYTLMSNGTGNSLIFDGYGESGELLFELLDYAFRQIRYIPADERWEIVREDGVVMVFGGGVTMGPDGNKHSTGNSVAWGVGFGNWLGTGSGGGQHQYGRSWFLSGLRGFWGDEVSYSYRAKEDAICSSGLNYTRATYLQSIVDVFGRTVTFSYRDKELFEYQPDHSDPVYQDEYETLYLSGLQVSGPDGNPITTIGFEHEFMNLVNAGVQDSFCKRYLTSITESPAGWETLPGYLFAYNQASDVNPGALASVTHPQGGVVDFKYEQQTLSKTSNNTTAQSKAGIPRVWFGPDYAVVTWYSAAQQQLEVDIYSWMGTWKHTGSSSVLTGIQLDLAKLAVYPEEKFFLLAFANGPSGGSQVQNAYLYEADPNRAGYWSSTVYQLPLQAGANPTTVATGSSFFVLANPGFTDGAAVRRYLKTPGRNEWKLSLPPVPGGSELLALAAGEACYIQCAYDQSSHSGRFELWYIKDFAWQAGSQWNEAFVIAAGQDWQNYFWSMGEGFAVATSVSEVTDSLANYEVRAYAWDSSYQLLGNAIVHQHQDSVNLPFLPAIVEHGLVANAHHLLRFDGSKWHPFDVPLPSGPDPSKIHFAYGEDVAVVSTPSGSVLAAFDPARLSWTPTSLSTPYGSTTIDGACLTIGSAVFQRQPNGQWQKQNTPLPPDTVDGSVRNRGSFLVFERNQGTSACACFVKNGATQQVLTLPEPPQSIATTDATSGMELVGANCFAAYPFPGTLDDSHILYFYYPLHDSVAGPQEVFRVSRVLLDAGMPGEAPICTAYLYDDDSVLYDPFGRVAKYHQVRKVTGADPNAPGSWAAPGSAPFGSQISMFYNGLQPGDSGIDTPSLPSSEADLYYNWLDGQLIGTNSFDSNGTRIASTRNTWEVSTTRATPNGLVPLAGAYSRIAAQSQTRDGVITELQYSYDAASGVRNGVQKQATKPDGTTLLFNQRFTSWWSIYDPGQSRNFLTAMVQTIESTTDLAGKQTVTSATATTWKNDWEAANSDWAEFETFNLAQRPDRNFSGFTCWNQPESPDPSVWLKVKSVASRSGQGQEQESLDVEGIASTTLYTADGRLPLLQVRNASVAGQELAFCGFETNEPAPTGWVYAESDLTAADCYTGSRCLALAETSGTAKLSGTFAPARGGQAYLLSFYSRSAQEVPGAYIEISFAGAADPPLQIPIQFTGPNWNFQCQPISFPASNGVTPAVTIGFFNASPGQTVLLDDVRFSPLCAIFEAYTYDPTSFTRSTKIRHDGRTARYLYDGYQRCIGTTDRDNEPDKLSLFYFSRQGNDDIFTPTDPNATIEIASNGGWFDDFRSTQWQDAWQATAGAWAVVSNALTLTGTGAGRIACKTTADYGSSGLRAYVTPPANVTQPFGITAGDATVSWSPGTGWQLEIAGAVCGAVSSAAIGPGEWLLVYAGRLVSFFFQGRQLFSYATSAPAEGGVALFAGDAVAFSEVMALRDPEVVATYADGAGQRRQRQELDGIACNVSAWLYDPIGNPAVATKACSYPGAGLGYRPGVITSFDWETGILSGDVALYYSSGGGGPSDDGGYPYRRTLFEDSPLGRPIEKGNPGAPYAIDLTNAERHTTRYAYGSQSTPLYAQFLTTPDGVQRTTLSDQLGKTWSVSFSAAAAVATSGFLYDPAGYLHHEQQPNYLTPPSGVPADWQIVNAYDFLGRLSGTASPDAGTTLYIRDRAGRQRFMLDAAGAVISGGLNAVTYWKYDDLGRLLEKGIVQIAWGDGTVLQSYANEDPDWPSLPASFQWAKRYVYDALSGGTTAPGHLCQVSTSQTGQSADVVEDFEYVNYGLVSRHGLTIPTSPMGRMVTVYHLDCRGRKTEIDYPAPQGEAAPLTVCYKYDDAGRLVQVGTPSAPGFFAAYTYYADNTIAQETLNPTGAKPMSLDFRYDSPQWLSSIGDSTGLWQQSTRYAPANGQPGSYDGLVSSDSQEYQWAGAPSGYTYVLTHGMSGSLSTAVNSAIPAWGVDTPVSYDPNGNILALPSGGSVSTYQYEPGSNRLANISTGNGINPTVGFTYDPDGSVTEVSGSGLTLSYEPASRLTAAISVAGSAPGTLAFLYGGRGQRVLKSMVTHGTRLFYLHGFDPRPLMERTESAAGPTNKLYIYGARGMLCLLDETFYWTALDRQGSTRLVLDAQGNVVATYDYLPFGGVARQTGSLPDITSYLYAGLELDAETKLYNNKARLYDPAIGRFYSCDPAGQYPSPYVYAGSAPMDLTDPTGDWSMNMSASIGIFAVLGLIAGALIGAGIGSLFVGAAEAGVAAAEAGAAAAEAGAAAAEAAPAAVEAEGVAAEAVVAGAAEPAAEAAPVAPEGWLSWGARGIGRGIGYVVRAPFTVARALAVGVGEANPEAAPLLQGAADYGSMAGRAAVDAAGAIANRAVSAASMITRTAVAALRGATIGGGLGVLGGGVLGDQLGKDD